MELNSIFKYAVLSHLSYNNDLNYNTVMTAMTDTCFEEKIFPFKFLQKCGTQCWVFVHGEEAIVVFRGTDSAQDLLNSIVIHYTHFKKCKGKIHMGYLYHYMNIRDELISELAFLKDTLGVKRVTLAGHSIGGSCALVCAADIKHNTNMGHMDVSVCTFGSPAAGDKAFYSDIEAVLNNYQCVVLKNDIVPVLFPCQKPAHILTLADEKISCIFNHNILKYISAIKQSQGRPNHQSISSKAIALVYYHSYSRRIANSAAGAAVRLRIL